jgi:hypothetical protein
MLGQDGRFLARVGDAADHARLMLANYEMRDLGYALPPSWEESAKLLESLLSDSAHNAKANDLAKAL